MEGDGSEAKGSGELGKEVIGMRSGLDLVYNDIWTKLGPYVADSVSEELKTMHSDGFWSQIQGRIGSGREAFVYHATDPSHRELVIKVFTVSQNEIPWRFDFTCRESLFLGFEFPERPLTEYYSYYQMESYGIRCPSPVEFGFYVVIAKFIGEGGVPAPTLSVASAQLSKVQLSECFKEMIRIMRTLCQMGESVHGDLSEANVLYHQDHLYVIDGSQSVDIKHICAPTFLYKDCCRVLKFFEAHNIPVMPAHVLYRLVSDQSITDEVFDNCVKEIVLDTGARGLWIKQIEGMEKNTVLPEYDESVIQELKKALKLKLAGLDVSKCYVGGYALPEYQEGYNASGASSAVLGRKRGWEESPSEES